MDTNAQLKTTNTINNMTQFNKRIFNYIKSERQYGYRHIESKMGLCVGSKLYSVCDTICNK